MMLQTIKNRLATGLFILIMGINYLLSGTQPLNNGHKDDFPVLVYFSPNSADYEVMLIPLSSTPNAFRESLAKQRGLNPDKLHLLINNKNVWNEDWTLKKVIKTLGKDDLTLSVIEKKIEPTKVKVEEQK